MPCLPKVSNLIASEIIRNEEINARVSAIEKWVAVADICRCLHNYNAVLEITSSLNRSAIFRLKKTWLKVSKQVGMTPSWGGGGFGGMGGMVLGQDETGIEKELENRERRFRLFSGGRWCVGRQTVPWSRVYSWNHRIVWVRKAL